MQIICQHFPTEPVAYQWQAWAPAFCMYSVPTGYGSTKHHAIRALKRILGVDDPPYNLEPWEMVDENLS